MLPFSNSLIGQSIGGYHLEEVLGRGGTGMVFLATRPEKPGEHYALKLLAPAWPVSPEELDALASRFLREADTLRRLRHPHIVPILAYGQSFENDINLSYMALPYLGGGTLTKVLADGSMALPLAAHYLSDLASAIDYAHGRGVVHRDIKPANILLDDKGTLFLTDFGIVRLFDQPENEALTAAGQVLGTPEYLSPEQAEGIEIGPAADIYSLGIVAFQMATGRVPFQGPTLIEFLKQHSQMPPPKPGTLRNDLPEPASIAILKALAKDPAERFQSASGFALAFAEGIEGRWAPEIDPGQGMTVRGFTPSKTISVKKDSADTTGPKTVAVTIPKADETPVSAGSDAKTNVSGENEIGKRLTALGDQGLAWVRSHPLEGSIGGGVLAILVIVLIVALSRHSVSSTTQSFIYQTNAPGTCDNNSSVTWTLNSGTDNCPSSGGLALTEPGSTNTIAEEQFVWKAHAFPTNYSISVEAANLANACVGFTVRRDNFAGYSMIVCQDGSWEMYRYAASDGSATKINSGKTQQTGIYNLQGSVKGSTLTFTVNGKSFFTTDATYTKTMAVGLLVVQFNSGQDGTATLSNFQYQFTPGK